MVANLINNPFRPGAGHVPPYLAGRTAEQDAMRRLLRQKPILENLVLTGLRGVGKTVLLETLKPLAREKNWLWVGTDLSESASLSEERLSIRILADLALITSSLVQHKTLRPKIGFVRNETEVTHSLDYHSLKHHFDTTPGLISDKLKATLELAWSLIPTDSIAGIVFAYDEAQTLSDHASAREFPLSLLLEVFQSLQRKGLPLLLVLSGLPTLFPKLVSARTYAERMFHVLFLQQLNKSDSHDAIVKPIEQTTSPVHFNATSVNKIIELSGGYPYFIQFICKEVFDAWLTRSSRQIPEEDIVRKLDADFFHGRWARASDRQCEILFLIASLQKNEEEFSGQELVAASQKTNGKHFSASHINQLLTSLTEAGLVYKNRHGKYSLAVPLLSHFIRRQANEQKETR